jgi:hypothetical protein
MAAQDWHRRYLEILVRQVEETRYPSSDIMNRIESMLRSRDDAARYIDALFDKVEDTIFPSLQLLDRIEGVLARIPSDGSDAAE